MVEAIVQSDYTAKEPDELTLKKGDVITEIVVQPGGWWEGRLKGKRGMFRDVFVKVIGDEAEGKLATKVTHRTVNEGKCRVKFSYRPKNDDELELKVNDIIDVLDEVEEGWWKGRLRNQTGVFPSNFVELIELQLENPSSERSSTLQQYLLRQSQETSPDASNSNKVNGIEEGTARTQSVLPNSDRSVPVLPPKPAKEYCKAMYKYEAENGDELSLNEGDVIRIINKDCEDKGWWRGDLNGRVGVFPENFVTCISPPEEVSKPKRPPTKAALITTDKVKDTLTKLYVATPPATLQKRTLETPPKIEMSREYQHHKYEKSSPPGISKKPAVPPPPAKKAQLSPGGSCKPLSSSPTNISDILIKREIVSPGNTMKFSASSIAGTAGGQSSDATNSVHLGKQLNSSTDAVDGAALSVTSSSVSSYSVSHCKQKLTSISTYSSSSSVDLHLLDKSEMDLNCVGRNGTPLTHLTANRVKGPPRRRPPSSLIAKDGNHELKANKTEMMNGNIEQSDSRHSIIKSSFKELRECNEKKPFTQGRTKVTIGGAESGGSVKDEILTSLESGTTKTTTIKSTSSGSVKDEMLTSLESGATKTSTIKSTSSNSTNNTVTNVFVKQTSPNAMSPRPHSMYDIKSLSPSVLPTTVVATVTSNSLRSFTVTQKQWTEMVDKVARLEATLKTQQERHEKEIEGLIGKLNEMSQKIVQFKVDVDRFGDLVTRV